MSRRNRSMTISPVRTTTAPDVRGPLTPLLRTNVHDRQQPNATCQTCKISDYHLVRELGSGTFGKVWLAKAKRDSQLCAIKVIEKRRIWLSDCKEALVSESKIMRKLNGKPFTLQILDSFSNPRFVFLALELAEMGNLENLLSKVIEMEFDEVAYYLVQISAGLNAIHNAQIIYRDLKPSNVLLTADGMVKLADFGLSKDVASRNGRANSMCGSLLYMAPEVIRGDVYSYSADWYSFGIVIHELYVGNAPYGRGNITDSRTDFIENVLTGNVELSRFIDPQGCDFFRWLTNMYPEKRPGSFNELMKHPWVAEIAWVDILHQKVEPPHVLSTSFRDQYHFSENQVDHSKQYETKDFEVDLYGSAFTDF